MNLQSTDRLQVRDLIEKLSRFDPMARMAISSHAMGVTNGSLIEIEDVVHGDDCVVYLSVEKPDEIVEFEKECFDLSEANDNLAAENESLKWRLETIKAALAKANLCNHQPSF